MISCWRIARKELEAVLVGQNDHIFSPFPLVAKYQARARRADGFSSILCKRVCASMAARALQEAVDIQTLESRREQTDGRRLTGAPTDPIKHGETGQPVFTFRNFIELAPFTR